ncbi:MAG: hypothetical protein EOO30_08635 [Comamonadaceae bacterium]|nr:MAG: hypothetical protein EOO30_08635 [Comamonadaceae bacterium]
MISAFAPLLPARVGRTARPARAAKRVRAKAADTRSLAWCVLLFTLLLQAALALYPAALKLGAIQSSAAFKIASGYTMLALLAFAFGFGALRRLPALAPHVRRLHELHQVAGLAIVVLLALHVGQRPTGFLLGTFHAMALGVACGALRTLVGPRAGRAASAGLLGIHIAASCLVAAAALLHLYFVYAYTA